MKHRFQPLVAGCCAALAIAGASASEPPAFDWDTITPSHNLEYHDCYGEFKCARLQVPLDWLNETDTRVATIAMIKLPAVVPDDDPTFGGAIFSNPGGPGGSGVDFLVEIGHYLRYTADKPGRRHYEIISFDPRGVGRTLPASDCYAGNLLTRDAFLLELRGNGPITRGDSTIAYHLALMDIQGQRCSQAGDAMAYVGTPSVARDLVEMVDKVDELRKWEAAQKQQQGQDDPNSPRLELKRSAPKRKPAKLGNEPGDVPRLQFIGFSYGTVLGNYFASMFPGRVGRLILDGVCDIDDYSAGPGWLTNTLDTDEVWDKFLEGCAAAGPEVCALARKSDNHRVSDIRRRLDSFLLDLDQKPKPVMLESGDVVVVTSADVRALIGMVLYQPIGMFKIVATKLSRMITGDLSEMASLTIGLGLMPVVRDACPLDNTTGRIQEPFIIEARTAVLCNDGDDVSHKDVSWWRKYVDSQETQSSIFGAIWAMIRLPCAGWRFRPNWQFKGPFTTPDPDLSLKSGRPAAPILFLSNRLDPVTPLRAAQAMAAQHPGARVIVQEAMGHCAVASAPSVCTKNLVADYFESGVIPADLSTCTAECGPWDEDCSPRGTHGTNNDYREAAHAWFNREESLLRRRSPLGLI